jgi:hypothetical protein
MFAPRDMSALLDAAADLTPRNSLQPVANDVGGSLRSARVIEALGRLISIHGSVTGVAELVATMILNFTWLKRIGRSGHCQLRFDRSRDRF